MEKWYILAFAAGFAVSAILMGILLPVLKKLKLGQQVRKDGPESHLGKQGTPTMGGFSFLPVILLGGLAFSFAFPDLAPLSKTVPVLALIFGFMLIGFLDDMLKIVRKSSAGLKSRYKLLLQLFVSAVFALYCYFAPAIGSSVRIPFSCGKTWDMGWLYIPFVILALLGTDNGTNFTDGADGLLASVTIVVCLFLAVLSSKLGIGAFLPVLTAGALFGYLLFNSNKALVFMGDTGSLALGGLVGGFAIVNGAGWYILLFGFVYLVEVLSVILQVGFFKLTHGKRIFKMAPIHHHFEQCGIKEGRLVALFTAVAIFSCFAAYLAI